MSSYFGPGRIALTLTAGILIASCAGRQDPVATGPTHMAQHYSQVHDIQRALIGGNIAGGRPGARWLSEHRGEEYGAAAGPSLVMMRNEATLLLRQNDILPASRALGRMGVACGDCHVALDIKVPFTLEEPPASAAVPAAQMTRHAWAMDRLWDGLSYPSDAAWKAGAGALTTMPVNFGNNEQANRLAARIHDLSGQAAVATTPKERADTYGDLLETCALCHSSLRLGSR